MGSEGLGRRDGRVALTRGDLRCLDVRLRKVPRWYRHYGWWKVRFDPVYALVLQELAGRRSVVDLGAGMGLLEALHLEREPDARVRAIEWDGPKADVARLLTQDMPGATVEEGDARTIKVGSPDAVLLLDLLHYFTPEEQKALLDRCAAALAPGGIILVRELDTAGRRAGMTRSIERLAVAVGWNRAARVQPWPLGDMRKHLEAMGFLVDLRPAGLGPFSGNALLVARKSTSPAEVQLHPAPATDCPAQP